MLISHSHKFIFIHNYKVAGTSIRHALMPYCYHDSKVNRVKKFFSLYPILNYNEFEPHSTALEVKELLPNELFESYFKFAFCRNPFDWLVSYYNFVRKVQHHHHHHKLKSMRFDDYIRWRTTEDGDFRLQKQFFCDRKGKLIIDFIGKFEFLRKDFEYVKGQVNVKSELHHLNVGNLNKTNGEAKYMSYYNFKTIQIVQEVWKEDFDFLGYEYIV